MVQNLRFIALSAMVAMSLGLTGCGGGGSSSTPTATTHTVGGTVAGLAAGQSVTLLDNGGDGYVATAEGSFSFAAGLSIGASYAVTVGTQPSGQTCSVTNGTGIMIDSDITNVIVTCLKRSESVLYSFSNNPDGADPFARLILDDSGNLYGTTRFGGTNGVGTVFKITPEGTESVLHSFTAQPDGADPQGGLVMDANGTLYGTTDGGGIPASYGITFKLTPNGSGGYTESVLHSFTSGDTDGESPEAGLILDANGSLYGTTYTGGVNLNGTVFKVNGDKKSVLYSFGSAPDGANPQAGLIMDANGNLYGTTVNGGANGYDVGNGYGTVFKIASDGTQSVLHSFDGTDGANPQGGLVMDAGGNLYGTTSNGGANNEGTVFKIASDGTLSVLHSFGTSYDGANPQSGLVMDAEGNLYGTTYWGGTNDSGTVFKIARNGTESVLHSFGTSPSDGLHPHAGLTMDANGTLYGTTVDGGESNNGTVFRITP